MVSFVEIQVIYSMVGNVGPSSLVHTLQYAADGMNFSKYGDIPAAAPSALGMYRTELTDRNAAGGIPEWGVYGVSSLARFDMNHIIEPSRRLGLSSSIITEGNFLSDSIGELTIEESANYSFDLLPFINTDNFAIENSELSEHCF